MRGTGITTKQIKNAPLNSIYIGIRDELHYLKKIAYELNRKDLKLISVDEFFYNDCERFRGLYITDIITDHAVNLSQKQEDFFNMIKPILIKRKK